MNELEKAYNGIEDAIGSLDYEGNYDVDTPRESLEYIKIYINNLQCKINKLNNENFELAKRIHNTKKIVNKVKKVSDYMNGIACDDLLSVLEGK